MQIKNANKSLPAYFMKLTRNLQTPVLLTILAVLLTILPILLTIL